MTLEEIVKHIEEPYNGNLNGVSILVCGAPDGGKLAVRLARHSAKVVMLTESADYYAEAVASQPQAVDMLAIHTNISKWICENQEHHFDVVVSFDSYLNIILLLSDCGKTVKIHYNADGSYKPY